MTIMAQMETATMFETVTAKTKNLPSTNKHERPKRECRSRKRTYDIELYSSKRLKYDQIDSDEPIDNLCTFGLTTSDTDEDNDTESKCSTSDDTEQSLVKIPDDNSDIEEIEDETGNIYFSKISSDQHRHIPVVLNETIIQQQQALSRHSKRLISQFKYLYDHGLRKSVQPTNGLEILPNQNNEIYLEKLRWELRNTFNRIDLFKEGYCVLSNEPFPFYSLCYMCGSMGSELIYCTNCCEAYHPTCLNEYERPRLDSICDLWLCPNCNVCNICGLLTHQNFLSRMANEQNLSPQLISCFDCKRNFHIKCIRKFKDDQLNDFNNLTNNNNNNNNNSIISLSRLSNSYLLNQTWFCPSCIKCDCGQALTSNERNILSLTKTFSCQQSLMCYDCLNNIKLIRLEKNDNIDKCHLCEKYIEQIYSKQQQQLTYFLQCIKCKNRFHPKCDGYLNEDSAIIPNITNLYTHIICSKCDLDERIKTKKYLLEYKLQAIETIISSILSLLQIIISDENHLNKLQSYILNLQQLHESRHEFLNLHIFLNDLLLIIRRLLTNNDIQRWQSAIDGCIIRQCPWFKSSSFLSNNKKISHHSSSINNNYLQPPPSMDHTYASNNEPVLCETSIDSLLNCLANNTTNKDTQFNNLHENDKRKCHICETLSDHISTNIGRLISFGINQWVHVGCILPAYAKNLDQPPYILRNIRETVLRCQTKYNCAICSKLGASVHCNENECYQRFHCECIQKYYSNIDKNLQQQLNIKNGFLPNLTTLCMKHNGVKTINNNHRESVDGINEDESKDPSNNNVANQPKLKSVNTTSTVYGDLSNNSVEFPLVNTRLCIGSLQIESLGNFDYQIEKNDENFYSEKNYPNNYRASRLFWSTKDPHKKTVYHLHIEIDQTYHNNTTNHRIIEHPMTNEQIHIEQLYETCRQYFTKFQKKIDDHLNSIEEFCQKTMINKKGVSNQSNYKKKTANTGTGGATKKLTKGTPSCVKRQTPKAALKNVSRPRNRFANEKNSQMSLTAKQNPSKDFKANDIQNLFNDDYFKTTNVSQFALALVQALRHVGQSTKIQQEPSSSYYSSDQNSNSSNGTIQDKNNDTLLKQLLKNIAVPQQLNLNDSQVTTMNSSHLSSYPPQWHSTISTQTETTSVSISYDDIRTKSLSQHSYASYPGNISLPHTTDSNSNLLAKPKCIPQVDGSIDDDDADDKDITISSIVINSLIEQIINKTNSERIRTDSEYSMDLSDYVKSPSLINFNPISPTNRSRQSKPSEKNPLISSYDLIQLYKKWLKLNFSNVKFTITNDEGYESISDDLDSAWSTVINLIRNCRDDMNLQHLPMTNEELNGHKIFGLTKPIIKIMLNQMYTNQQQIGSIILPLSSSSSTLLNNNPTCSLENYSKKSSSSSCSRSNVYDRKTRERQRFGWLLNQSRKIEYALKSFEIDDALAYTRRILLAEASVSLRLYHLHYFSERALLVGSSPIHGCGLFTLIDLVEGQMIVEYSGEVVRPCLTDKRERENEGKGFGCYMFTVDSMNVIDATHRGNKARFINHNCQPNCFAKTVLSGGSKHIVIYALKDIARGSELTYDYSFPEEDVKIPCHCGTSQCRIYLN
ncbi:unnamed protein product [Adineta steineri]|uniref:Histone-lysine N-methyltransferase n=1 Tax=Adineta steineri TaxID=433720 RepID=A0A813U6L9_9BILA|nr:unnamed protein product [Adineta steineri]CAF3676387.1 unnamed protein product [Adineta steineri]